MRRGLLIVDVQRDFCEGGSLAVEGGAAVAQGITKMLGNHSDRYARIITSQDWHNPLPDTNGGHFAPEGAEPDYVNTWPVHCVAGTEGADFHPDLVLGWDGTAVVSIRKGMGRPDYSAFQGVNVTNGYSLNQTLRLHGIGALDVVGIATDHCVRASVLHGLQYVGQGLTEVRVLTDLCAGVDSTASANAVIEIQRAGGVLIQSDQI